MFEAATGAFSAPQLDEERGLRELGEFGGIAVGEPGDEQDVYVTAYSEPKEGKAGPVLAVFGPSGKLQPDGIWTGHNTPEGSFVGDSNHPHVAVDDSGSLVTGGDVYVSNKYSELVTEENKVTHKKETHEVVHGALDVFAGEPGGGEGEYLGQLTGTCEKQEESPPLCSGSKFIPFESFAPEASAVAVSPEGDVLVANHNVVDVFEPVSTMPGLYTYKFLFKITITGTPKQELPHVKGLAGDSEGDIYVAYGVREEVTFANYRHEYVVDQFNAAGQYVGHLTGTPAGPFNELEGVAVEPVSGDVYVTEYSQAQNESAVDAFGPTRVIPDVTTVPATTAVRVTASGEGRLEATLNGTVNPLEQGEATCGFVWGVSEAFGQATACQPEGVPNGNAAVEVKATINEELTPDEKLEPDTTYWFRLQASNGNGANPGEAFQDEKFTTPGPGIRSVSASDVSATAATLRASIDPHGAATSCYFQYGTSTGYGAVAPVAPGVPLGSGEADVRVAPHHIQDLLPGTVYHYRAVVVSELVVEGKLQPVVFYGPDQSFRTQGASAAQALPDGRRWELVSPPDKHGALLEPIGGGGGVSAGSAVIQAAASGAGITYVATVPTEDVEGYVYEGVQVFSSRGVDGWSSRNVSLEHATPTGLPVGIGKEYRAFSADLSLGLVEPIGEYVSLAPEVFPPDTGPTPYIRHDLSCQSAPGSCFEPLLTGCPAEPEPCPALIRENADIPAGTDLGHPEFGTNDVHGEAKFVGASGDLTHAIVSSKVALTSQPAGEW